MNLTSPVLPDEGGSCHTQCLSTPQILLPWAIHNRHIAQQPFLLFVLQLIKSFEICMAVCICKAGQWCLREGERTAIVQRLFCWRRFHRCAFIRRTGLRFQILPADLLRKGLHQYLKIVTQNKDNETELCVVIQTQKCAKPKQVQCNMPRTSRW